MTKVVIGTRGSKLALWQAHFTRDKLQASGIEVEIKIIRTKGDEIQHLGFDKIEGKGFFTKEIEDALLEGDIDLAVHSCKDMPTTSPEGLAISAYSYRESPVDVLLAGSQGLDDRNFLQLKTSAVIGTSSARRKAQLLSLRPDIELKDIRGNVPTRIRKLNDGEFDAILLAAAGLNRLEEELSYIMKGLARIDLPPTMFIPAPAQGVLAYQVRRDNDRMKEALDILNDENSMRIAGLERNILAAFDGGCQVPIGIYAEERKQGLHTWVSKATAWDAMPKRMFFGPEDPDHASAILSAFNSPPVGDVFISTQLSDDDIFKRYLEAMDTSVTAQPLIQFRPVEFSADPDVDWLFFSSKNAAAYFFADVAEIAPHTRIAAINQGTAGALAKLGRPADFTGAGGSMKAIAEAFDNLDGERVLFPRASHSRRTIQGLLKNKTVSDVVVYDNFPVEEVAVRQESILVFTSPMNVDSYFSRHNIAASQQVVAIGSSTAKAIKDFGVDCVKAFEPTRWALVDIVTRLLSKNDIDNV